MGFAWHPSSNLEVGIDGQIEFRDPGSEEAIHRIVRVQSKAQSGPFPNENGASFSYYAKRSDIDFWLQSPVPVILVCSHPASEGAWYVCIQEWAAGREADSTRIDFDKEQDAFDESAALRLLGLTATASTPVGFTQPASRAEALVSNLLPLTEYPEHIFTAATACRRPADAWERLREANKHSSEWVLADGRLYSLRDLNQSPARVLCDGPISSFPTEQWALAPDRDLERRFVRLLNQTLRERHHADLRWHGRRHYFYFRATPDLSVRKVRSGHGNRGRTVFGPYLNKRDQRKVAYYRHAAFERQFVRIENEWFLQIVPTYHYTYDGERESYYAAEYLRKIKQRERNIAVRDHVLMWARYLRGERTLIDAHDPILGFGELISFKVERGIDDRSWAKPKPKVEASQGDQLFPAA